MVLHAEGLHFWALIPSDPVQKEITAFKLEAGQLFHTTKALRSPAHVTLIPPFRGSDRQILDIDLCVAEVAQTFQPFDLVCQGFGCFAPRVIFVSLLASDELRLLHQTLTICSPKAEGPAIPYPSRFHPHMTVAFRDLDRQVFSAAWTHFQSRPYERSWTATGIWRLTHAGASWHPQRFFPFVRP